MFTLESLASSRAVKDDAPAVEDAASGASDWAYETIAGRCAMAGYAIGAQIEAQSGATLANQASTATGGFVAVALCCLIAWASISPFEFNPQEYGADPNGLKEKKGMSGFLAMEALNLNPDVERAHGRLAMVGFVGTALVEAALGRSVF
jgi:hypothetical protein